jgi:hypothetical protein
MFYKFSGTDESLAIGPNAADGSVFGETELFPWEYKPASLIVPFWDHLVEPESAEDLFDVFCTGLCVAVSPRLHDIIAAGEPSNGFTMSPIRILTREGVALSDYWLLWSLNRLHVLDKEHSTFIRYPTGRIMKVTKEVLDKRVLPECDIFCSDQFKWYISEGLRVAIEAIGPTGCEIVGPVEGS